MQIISNWLDDIPGPHRGQEIVTTGAPLDEARVAVVMLHGRGTTNQNILELAGVFTGEHIAYLAPQAGRRSWYPFSFLEERAKNEPALSSAHAAVAAIIEQLVAQGFEHSRIVLLGFSQGACLATDHAALNPKRYGAVVGFSGGLIGDEIDADAYSGSLDGTPVYLGCSDVDPHIPEVRVHETAAVMERLGAQVTTEIYPSMPHTIIRQEVDQVQAILDSI